METNLPLSDLIRPVTTTTDADAFLMMMETFCHHFHYPFDRPLRQQLIRDVLDNPQLGSLWLIEHGDQPVGYVVLTYGFAFEFGGKTALVDELFIEESYRGAGRGHQVLRRLQQMTRELGVSTLFLQTEKYNPRAKQLYESLGFIDQDRSTLMWTKSN